MANQENWLNLSKQSTGVKTDLKLARTHTDRHTDTQHALETGKTIIELGFVSGIPGNGSTNTKSHSSE